jgi:hypothetical protein
MDDDIEGRLSARTKDNHPIHDHVRGILETLNNLKSSSQDAQAAGPQQPNPAQIQAMQQQQMQQMQMMQGAKIFQGIQTAIQTAQSMDPLERFRIAKELANQQKANALSGMEPQGDSYMLNDRALAAKNYPNAFGAHGKRAQQILLASGMLHPNMALGPSDHYSNAKNYLD